MKRGRDAPSAVCTERQRPPDSPPRREPNSRELSRYSTPLCAYGKPVSRGARAFGDVTIRRGGIMTTIMSRRNPAGKADAFRFVKET